MNQKITGQTDADGNQNFEIIVPLKYLSNFWRTLEMPLLIVKLTLSKLGLKNVLYHIILIQIKQQHLQ